jgi:hypothetical protein
MRFGHFVYQRGFYAVQTDFFLKKPLARLPGFFIGGSTQFIPEAG